MSHRFSYLASVASFGRDEMYLGVHSRPIWLQRKKKNTNGISPPSPSLSGGRNPCSCSLCHRCFLRLSPWEREIPVEELTKRTTSYGPRTLRDVGSGLVRGSEKPHMLSKTGQYRNCPHGEIDMK